MNIDLDKIRRNGIFVSTPCYGGQCFGRYAFSLAKLAEMCAMHQIPLYIHQLYNESLIPRARNYCVDEFLRATFKYREGEEVIETSYKHMLFIDSDIEFSPESVLQLVQLQLAEGNDVVCGPYTKKAMATENIKAAVDQGLTDLDHSVIEDFIGDFVFNLPDGITKVSLSAPFEVKHAGTGFMMIKRSVFEAVEQAKPEFKYYPDHGRTEHFDGSRMITAYFQDGIDQRTKQFLSEDYFFCQVVRELGMKVWIVPNIYLPHHGYYAFRGKLGAVALLDTRKYGIVKK